MKKVKILLFATALVTVAGGTLAFKASKFSQGRKVYTCNLAQNTCSITHPESIFNTTTQGLEFPSATATFDNVQGAGCSNVCDKQVTVIAE